MYKINESLKPDDLRDLVNNIFEIDNFSSKMGDDQDIVVLSFTLASKESAEDLVNFIERGYEFVLDADASPAQSNNSEYNVFVELERTKKLPKQIMEIIYGIKQLTGELQFKFRYYKSFKSIPVSEENLTSFIPTNKDDYNLLVKQHSLDNFSNFFSKSFLEDIHLNGDDIVFQKKYNDPLRMKILNSGPSDQVFNSAAGHITLESNAIAECLFLTKYIGDYNITKIGNSFVFNNNGFSIMLGLR